MKLTAREALFVRISNDEMKMKSGAEKRLRKKHLNELNS